MTSFLHFIHVFLFDGHCPISNLQFLTFFFHLAILIVCVLVSTVGLWIASNCLIVLFSVSAIFRADVIVKSLLSFSKDFYVTLRCMLNIKSLTKMVSYSHCQRLFKKTCANSLASCLCLKIWKFALGFLCSCLQLFSHHPERQKSFIYLFALVSCPNYLLVYLNILIDIAVWPIKM